MDEFNTYKIIEQVPIRDQVADIVRRKVLKGEFQGDEKITERQISEMLNVSVTPVKEAFRVLQSEGLIYTKPRIGSFVSAFSKEITFQLVFMLGALEGTAAYFAAKFVTDEDICLMEEALKEAGELLDPLKLTSLSKKNKEFHSILRNASHNDYLINLINNLQSLDRTFNEVSLSSDINEPLKAHYDHLSILKAVKRRDPEESEKRMVKHIRRIALFVMEDQEKQNNQERGGVNMYAT